MVSADPRTFEAQLAGAIDRENGLKHELLDLYLKQKAMVPLWDVWLTARPPCPTCDGTRYTERQVADRHYVALVGGPCPDCSDGVQPFDKWTAGLAALWTAVHGGIPYDYPALGREVLDELRKIGGTQ